MDVSICSAQFHSYRIFQDMTDACVRYVT